MAAEPGALYTHCAFDGKQKKDKKAIADLLHEVTESSNRDTAREHVRAVVEILAPAHRNVPEYLDAHREEIPDDDGAGN